MSCKDDFLASISADLLDCDGLLELKVDANSEHDSSDDEPAAAAAAAEFLTSAAEVTANGPKHDSGDAGPAVAAVQHMEPATAKNPTDPTAGRGTFPIDNRPDSLTAGSAA